MAIATATFDGAPLGSNLAARTHEIPDTQARYIQDAFVDQSGLIVQRGPAKTALNGTIPSLSAPPCGIAQTYRPDGVFRAAVIYQGPVGVTTEPTSLQVLGSPFTSTLGTPNIGLGVTSTATYFVDAKSALGGGTVVGYSPTLAAGTGTRGLFFWHGAKSTSDYTTGTAACTTGSATITGTGTTWVGNAEPGMYLFITIPGGSNALIGVVKSVDSNTQITLTQKSEWTAAASTYNLKTTRGFAARYRSGRISTSTSSTVVTGSATNFKANLIGTTSNWRILRASTLEFVGTASVINSDTTLTLASNAAVTLDDESYIAVQMGAGWGLSADLTNGIGFLTASHKFRQWYANAGQTAELTSRLWFSETNDKEAVDFDPTVGNFVDIPSVDGPLEPIAALASTETALLLLKETEAFALLGDTPEQFSLTRLDIDDGTLSPMSVQQVDTGVVFAGRNGIYLFDGQTISNIVEGSLGRYYRDMMAGFDSSTYRLWSMVADNHYFLFIENASPSYTPTKGATPETVSRLTLSVYLPTGAVSFHTNLDIRGSIRMPATFKQGTWFAYRTSGNLGTVCSTVDLRSTAGGRDALTAIGGTPGPDFYVETKRYDIGDSLRKKLFSIFLLKYIAAGDTLRFDTVLGMDEVGTTSTTQFPTQSTFLTQRAKFLKRETLLGFRLYGNSSSVTNVQLGPWSIGFKLQRAGRP